MTRMPPFQSPLLVGFDLLEKKLERVAKGGDGYPPYNIERVSGENGDQLRITLAVAGFTDDDLDIVVEQNQLVIEGRQAEDIARDYLHRGIAARQFRRTFVLADGMRVIGAELRNGLLTIALDRPEPEQVARRITIRNGN